MILQGRKNEVRQSINQSTDRLIYQSNEQSINQSTDQSINRSTDLSAEHIALTHSFWNPIISTDLDDGDPVNQRNSTRTSAQEMWNGKHRHGRDAPPKSLVEFAAFRWDCFRHPGGIVVKIQRPFLSTNFILHQIFPWWVWRGQTGQVQHDVGENCDQCLQKRRNSYQFSFRLPEDWPQSLTLIAIHRGRCASSP